MSLPVDQYLNNDYLAKNPTWDAEDAPWKIELVQNILCNNKIIPRSILEVGCGSGACLAQLRRFYPNARLSGTDISPSLKHFWKEYQDLDIHFSSTPIEEDSSDTYDLLLLLDVIEHVADPHLFLKELKGRAQYYIFHIPLDLSAMSVLRESPLLYVRNKVGHIHYFTKGLALALLSEAGFEVIDVAYSGAAMTAPKRNWSAGLIRQIRCFVFLMLGQGLGSRLVGGETLIVLAKG